ncbi:MAG: hypothetical protein ACE5IR_21240 [bacterium]
MTDFPFETSLVIVIAAISLLLSLLTFISMIVHRVRRTLKRFRDQPITHISITQNCFRFIATILWLTASVAVLFLAAFIQSYQRFTHEELVAEVRCVSLDDEESSLFLELTPVRDGEKMTTQEFVIHGDQWALEGDVLKWDDWMNFVGVHTLYKLTRIRGRFVHYQDEIDQTSSVYSLVEKEERPQWRWLYKYGHKLRFVSAVYGNTVYTFPSEEHIYQVYATTSGFIVRVPEG